MNQLINETKSSIIDFLEGRNFRGKLQSIELTYELLEDNGYELRIDFVDAFDYEFSEVTEINYDDDFNPEILEDELSDNLQNTYVFARRIDNI